MALKLACPRCQHVEFYDEALAGQPVHCAKCEQAFRVPRFEVPVIQEPTTVQWPLPSQMQAREMPSSFEPLEPLHAKVVPLPDLEPMRPRRRNRDEELDDPVPAIARRTSQGAGSVRRPRIATGEPSRGPWAISAAGIAFVLLLFVGTAVWFLAHEHRPPVQPQVGWQQPQFNPQLNPPQFKQPAVQPQFPRPVGPPMLPMQQMDPRQLEKGRLNPVLLQPNERVTELKMVDGQVQVRASLTLNDPPDMFLAGSHRKLYSIQLEANRNYTFEMNMDPPRLVNPLPVGRGNDQGRALDPYLIIEDEQGKVLAWNDDIVSGANLNSRIPSFRTSLKGTYRIVATSFAPNQSGAFVLMVRDEDRGRSVVLKPLPPLPLPQPTAPGQALAVQRHPKQRHHSIATLLTTETPFVGDFCWSANGLAYFTLDETGILRRIALDAAVEERRLELGHAAGGMAMSRQGLVVALQALEEVWVIDPNTLAVKRRLSAPGVQRIAAAPTQDFAFAASRQKANPLPKDTILVLDAAKGAPARQYDFSPKHAVVSQNGKYLFAEGGIETLVRYRIQQGELILDEESARLAGKGQGIFLSPDSQHVCLTSPVGNYAGDPAVPLKPYTTLIFKTDNLRKPAFTINTGEAPRTVGFAPKAGFVLAHNNETQFMLFSATGVKSLEMNLPGADRLANEPRQFLTHPDGFRVLVRTERTLYLVEMPRDEEN